MELSRQVLLDTLGLDTCDLKTILGAIQKQTGHILPPIAQLYFLGRLCGALVRQDITKKDILAILDGQTPSQWILNAAMNTTTSFFRDFDRVFPVLAEHISLHPESANILVAPSSSGETVYSLAMGLAEIGRESPFSVDGLDIHTDAIEHAQNGHYPCSSFDEGKFSAAERALFAKHAEYTGEWIVIAPALREHVRFFTANVLESGTLGILEDKKYNVVTIGNLFVHFSRKDTLRTLENIRPVLAKKGIIIVTNSAKYPVPTELELQKIGLHIRETRQEYEKKYACVGATITWNGIATRRLQRLRIH